MPVCVSAYYGATGHWPDLNDSEDMAKLGAEAFAFINLARFAVPLRIGLALGSVPFIQTQILDRFFGPSAEEGYWYQRRDGTGVNPAVRPIPPPAAPPMSLSGVAERSAPEIFFGGLDNLRVDPKGWWFGAPSPLYSNAAEPPRPGAGPPTASSEEQARQAWIASVTDEPWKKRTGPKPMGEAFADSAMGMVQSVGEADPAQFVRDNGVEGVLRTAKDTVVAAAVGYLGWELLFFTLTVPVLQLYIVACVAISGEPPDFSNDFIAGLVAEGFALVNLARSTVTLRVLLALGSIPLVQSKIMEPFFSEEPPNGRR